MTMLLQHHPIIVGIVFFLSMASHVSRSVIPFTSSLSIKALPYYSSRVVSPNDLSLSKFARFNFISAKISRKINEYSVLKNK